MEAVPQTNVTQLGTHGGDLGQGCDLTPSRSKPTLHLAWTVGSATDLVTQTLVPPTEHMRK